MKIVINGEFYDHKITGVQRYAHEIVKQLDVLNSSDKISIEVAIPDTLVDVPKYNNIKVVKLKDCNRLFWKQIRLMNYCKKNDADCLCLCDLSPYFYYKRSINVIHDAATKAHPEFYSKKFLFYNRVMLWNKIGKLKKIITVSEFSKDEISKYSGVNKDSILVAKNSWNHMENVGYDDSIFNEYPVLKEKKYCYSLSSLSPNKNFKWIIEVAKRNPGFVFVISGMKIGLFSDELLGEIPENVLFTGYVSDQQVKSLMKNCDIYLFPTLYEGFGITPLEALSAGCKIAVSDTPCMKEIYKDVPIYFDPYNYDFDVESACTKEQTSASVLLDEYLWFESAKVIFDYLVSEC